MTKNWKRIQSDVEEEGEGDEEEKEGSIHSDDDEEVLGIESVSTEPLYVLPLYAILPSDKQARVSRSFVRLIGN